MTKETILQVELDGQTYVLRGTGSKQRLKQIADIAAQKIAAVRKLCPQYSTTRTAMLAALQIAEQMLDLQEEYHELLDAADIGELDLNIEGGDGV